MEVRRDTFLGCDPDRHYNRASARLCYPARRVPLRPAASEGEGTYAFVPTAASIHRIRIPMHDRNQCVRDTLNVPATDQGMMRTLPPPATPTSNIARISMTAGNDSSSTFGVGTVELQP